MVYLAAYWFSKMERVEENGHRDSWFSCGSYTCFSSVLRDIALEAIAVAGITGLLVYGSRSKSSSATIVNALFALQ